MTTLEILKSLHDAKAQKVRIKAILKIINGGK